MAIRLLIISALASFSSETSYFNAYAMTGMLTVIPWFPLPELLIAGNVHPAILASEAAAVSAMAYETKSLPNTSTELLMVLPTFNP